MIIILIRDDNNFHNCYRNLTENKRLNRIEFKKIRNFYQMTIIFLRQRKRDRNSKRERKKETEREAFIYIYREGEEERKKESE